jgi:hypothetical protein
VAADAGEPSGSTVAAAAAARTERATAGRRSERYQDMAKAFLVKDFKGSGAMRSLHDRQHGGSHASVRSYRFADEGL